MIKKRQFVQKILKISFILLCAIYTFLYSKTLSFDVLSMKIIYIALVVILIFLDEESILYFLFFFLPLRKLVYFDNIAFFNIILLFLILKQTLRAKKIPYFSLICALIFLTYDILISLLTLPSYHITLYMIKWYFSIFVFFVLLNCNFRKFDYKKSIIYLNIGLTIVGFLTIYQYSEYSTITSYIREIVAGAGGTLDQNTYSFFCIMGGISAIAFFLDPLSDKSNKRENMLIIVTGLFSLFCGMFMVSKAFYLVLIIIILIIIMSFIKYFKQNFKYLLIGIIGIICCLQINRFNELISSILLRFTSAGSDISKLTTGRSELLAFYLPAILNKPLHFLFGAGISTYSLYYRPFDSSITHNTTLEMLAAWGVVGIVLLLLLVVMNLKKVVFANVKKINIYSLLPLITIILFSQTLAMMWEDASWFFMLYSLYFAIHLKIEKN